MNPWRKRRRRKLYRQKLRHRKALAWVNREMKRVVLELFLDANLERQGLVTYSDMVKPLSVHNLLKPNPTKNGPLQIHTQKIDRAEALCRWPLPPSNKPKVSWPKRKYNKF